jgi:uncharacterized protein (DUF58 family)
MAFIGVAVAAVAMGILFGQRALNAVVAPILVALFVGFVQVKRTSHPTLDVTVPKYGFRDEEGLVSVAFSTSNPFTGSVTLHADDGLAVADETVETTVGNTTVEFTVELVERGDHRVGPVTIVAEDVFGLFRRELTQQVRETVLVFPKVSDVDSEAAATLFREEADLGADREFDQLREYERGDPLSDVHWKSTAKHPGDDMFVREFQPEDEEVRVEMVAEADGDRVDDVADAAASIGAAFLDAGFAVGLTVPKDRVPPGKGDAQRTELFTLLAHMGSGQVRDRDFDGASVVVRGRTGRTDTEIRIGHHTASFDEFAAGSWQTPETDPPRRTVRADGGDARTRPDSTEEQPRRDDVETIRGGDSR